MQPGEQIAAYISAGIKSGRDVYVYDHYLGGSEAERFEQAVKVLIEKRYACSDADEAASLTSIICALEKAKSDARG
jgi:hypothetical protein